VLFSVEPLALQDRSLASLKEVVQRRIKAPDLSQRIAASKLNVFAFQRDPRHNRKARY
jgi:hypothetical protein